METAHRAMACVLALGIVVAVLNLKLVDSRWFETGDDLFNEALRWEETFTVPFQEASSDTTLLGAGGPFAPSSADGVVGPSVVLVMGWGDAACRAVAETFADHVKWAAPLAYEEHLETTKKTLLAARAVVEYVGDVSLGAEVEVAHKLKPEIRLAAQDAIRALLAELETLSKKNGNVVAVVPHLRSPNVKSPRTGAHIRPVIVVEDGLAASFRDNDRLVDILGPSLVDEDVLDTICMLRLRPRDRNLTGDFASTNQRQFREAIFAGKIYTNAAAQKNTFETPPCQITDLPLFRNAIIWSKVSDALLRAHRTRLVLSTSSRGSMSATLPLMRVPSRDACKSILEHLAFRAASEAHPDSSVDHHFKQASTISVPSQPTSSRKRKRRSGSRVQNDAASELVKISPCSRFNEFAVERLTTHLAEDLELLLDTSILQAFGYETPLLSRSALANLPKALLSETQIDAGYCEEQVNLKRLSLEQRTKLTFSVARCLPSFLIIGAQKAGTDELGVWLNQIMYARRLDGGVEIHFFDCLGRGRGWRRPSCARARRAMMQADTHAGLENLTIALEAGQKRAFAWSELRKESIYLSSWWKQYLSLCNLFYTAYARRSMTFEKSPAYMDLSHPMDIVRMLPSAKLVFMVRDPVLRFVSSYFQMCSGMYQALDNCTYIDLRSRFDVLHREFDPESISHQIGDASVDYFVRRGLAHSMYAHWLQKWRAAFPDEQIMLVFSEHFRNFPQGVIFAIESFLGLRLPRQHHYFRPHKNKQGFYVLGEYSKANNPSHKSDPPSDFLHALRAFYRPHNTALRRLIDESGIHWRPLQEVPKDYKADFSLPSWLAKAD
ncbi:Heparan sulfate glucosamine 3-O-sulfotransferase 4 [Hondaea fermentalgiana]|uniref:Heparan sulfate glucosamine 3-O-sulfotransferase 4 n=1 Tax=Hondaea fermentalgiana TaxID=2315210 RepID=A0A2R5GGT9_9STRA|nr:Heparan sulfate glucosamine 3-O-sulfotransferase 4 [Hondaea fermentalgiana]|eukprot:GBG30102.1 Heparan sulfate glucosamine 3-O-sulfotransferase 4 [Hondaea fermentalgiana]